MVQRMRKRRGKRPEIWAPVPLPVHASLRVPVLAQAFQELGVGASLWLREDYWHAIHNTAERDVTAFELELDAWEERGAYNRRMLVRAQREGGLVIGEHAGFADAFVPIVHRDGLEGILVVGPFARTRPTSVEVQRRWQGLTGGAGRLTDPVFARYLASTLTMLVLEGGLFDSFCGFVTCLARLLGGRPGDESATLEAQTHRLAIIEARSPERMWENVRRLIEERSTRPPAPLDHGTLAAFRLKRTPEHVVCALVSAPRGAYDSMGDVIHRGEFQRASVGFAKKLGGVIAGRIGDHGVVLLVDAAGSPARIRDKLAEVAAKAAALARRFGFRLHAGIGSVDPASLAARYRSALWAAEKALSLGQAIVLAAPQPTGATELLRDLRAELGRAVTEPAHLLWPRFNRYVEAVLAHSGYRLEATRAELAVGLERLIEPLVAGGVLDRKSHDELLATLTRDADNAVTVAEVLAAYQHAISDIESAFAQPVVARQERGLERALRYVRDHLTEALTVPLVARVAGFAPDYFSRLFKREQKTSLGRYVLRLRIEHAQQMLAGTELSVDQIQRLSGFRTRTHFHWAFKKLVGVPPIAYREGAGAP